MIKILKLLLPALVLSAGILLWPGRSLAKPELAKKEKTSCTTCHAKMGAKELNEAGKEYKEKGKLPDKK